MNNTLRKLAENRIEKLTRDIERTTAELAQLDTQRDEIVAEIDRYNADLKDLTEALK